MNLNNLVSSGTATTAAPSVKVDATAPASEASQRVSLPPISDILVSRLPPVPGAPSSSSILPPLPHQSLPFAGGPPPVPQQDSRNLPPNYKYYDYYYGSNVPSHSLANHSISHSTALTRSPLSHNSSPVYGTNTTPPPAPPTLRHNSTNSYNLNVQYPPHQHQHIPHPHQPPHLYKTHSSPIGGIPTILGAHIHQGVQHLHQRQQAHELDDERSLSPGNKRKTRNNLPKEITYILLKWLNDHLSHPYPNSFEKNQLMMMTGLNQQQLSNWFINARRRKIKSLKEQKRLNLV
ncbi:predicted protein [Scheffersomyces stipitis CBS 6054]|uniref:Homeobox domain-containing protein n=1 Tax=Scheffersomyces stipitis (strain ATCC 58785 / CBS 6054 / NBRC 10063 / NRRL Y-11545) TaxID=322104 RepID=A3LWD3_PICST|nr:predicted protein [Scheffersomyces stipitis CBS 6054]ABN66947.2 predicted protein [Scheffersomyces stipitis CBS 6054]KAG2734617.1 hypothetical protein G9P44_002623 [Scheffersomyces stipitis]